VLGDGDRLQQVVWNLLTNAIKFTPVGGHVRVGLTSADGHAELTVSDDGEGITAEFLPHVFERFQQAMGGSARAHGGLGIGLTIVKNLVELHGGTIRATSDGHGRGSTFAVVLPTLAAIEAPVEVAPSEPARETLVDLTGLRVLAVEDDLDSRELLATVLGQSGAVAHAAASAAEAFRLFTSGTFDVLVSDIGLPGEDGYGLISRIRTLSPTEGGRIPAVALTAFARGDDRTRALRAGFDMHLPKPVEPAELVAVLGNLTGRRR
jgi:CheY-like chemotaxis protein